MWWGVVFMDMAYKVATIGDNPWILLLVSLGSTLAIITCHASSLKHDMSWMVNNKSNKLKIPSGDSHLNL